MARKKVSGRKCRIESLEDRRMLAGSVTAKVSNGNLVVTGDWQGNGVTLTPGANPYEVVVTGTTVAGLQTRINGVSNGAITFKNVTKNVTVKLGGGHDVLNVNNVTVYEDAKIKTGKGLDTVTINVSTFNDALKVKTGKGVDNVTVANSVVAGKMTLSTGASRDIVNLNNLALGKLKVSLGKGNDALSISSTTVISKTVLNGNSGINTLATNGSFFGSTFLKRNLAGT